MTVKIPVLEIKGIEVISPSEWSDEYLRNIGREILHKLHKELMCSPEIVSEDGVALNSAKIIVRTHLEV